MFKSARGSIVNDEKNEEQKNIAEELIRRANEWTPDTVGKRQTKNTTVKDPYDGHTIHSGDIEYVDSEATLKDAVVNNCIEAVRILVYKNAPFWEQMYYWVAAPEDACNIGLMRKMPTDSPLETAIKNKNTGALEIFSSYCKEKGLVEEYAKEFLQSYIRKDQIVDYLSTVSRIIEDKLIDIKSYGQYLIKEIENEYQYWRPMGNCFEANNLLREYINNGMVPAPTSAGASVSSIPSGTPTLLI